MRSWKQVSLLTLGVVVLMASTSGKPDTECRFMLILAF